MTGKWHVTKFTRPKSDAEKHNWPLQRGFDRFYGTIHGAGSFFDPNTLVRDNQLISAEAQNGKFDVPALNMQGGLIRANGRVIAFSIAAFSPLRRPTSAAIDPSPRIAAMIGVNINTATPTVAESCCTCAA